MTEAKKRRNIPLPLARRTRALEDDESPEGTGTASSLVAIPDYTKLALRVHLRLASCRNLLMRESRRTVEGYGLTLPQFDALAELGRAKRGGFTFGELSRMLLVTSGNLTGIVDRLESDGLARREQGKRDRRVVRIVLTRKGRRLVALIAPQHARDIQAALSFMPASQLETLNELLGALRDGLRERPGSPRHAQTTAAPVVPMLSNGTRNSET